MVPLPCAGEAAEAATPYGEWCASPPITEGKAFPTKREGRRGGTWNENDDDDDDEDDDDDDEDDDEAGGGKGAAATTHFFCSNF